MTKTYTIDATGQTLGRLASRIATLLQGKNRTTYARNASPAVTIRVVHCAAIKLSPKKEKIYYRSTGYPGNVIQEKLTARFASDPAKVLRSMVAGMLPKNNQRKTHLLHLRITNA